MAKDSDSYLKFPSGLSVERAKQAAKKLKKAEGLTQHAALDQIAKDNGLDMPWQEAIRHLRDALNGTPDNRGSVMEEQAIEEMRSALEKVGQLSATMDDYDALKAAIEKAHPEIRVHIFQDTGDAYNATQVDPDIKSGDVLLAFREEVVGVADTWPVAVTEKFGALHTLEPGYSIEEYKEGVLAEGYRHAQQLASELYGAAPGMSIQYDEGAAARISSEVKEDEGLEQGRTPGL